MDYDGDGSTSWCWRVLDLTASCSLPPNDRVMCNTLTALAAWQCASHIHILYMHIWHLSDLDKIAKVCHLPQDVDELARTDEPDTLRCKWRRASRHHLSLLTLPSVTVALWPTQTVHAKSALTTDMRAGPASMHLSRQHSPLDNCTPLPQSCTSHYCIPRNDYACRAVSLA
jgi:hypothetical protein